MDVHTYAQAVQRLVTREIGVVGPPVRAAVAVALAGRVHARAPQVGSSQATMERKRDPGSRRRICPYARTRWGPRWLCRVRNVHVLGRQNR